MRLIDADALKEAFKKCYPFSVEFPARLDDMCNIIDNAPTIEAEPVKHGHWVFFKVDEWGASNCKCSECGEEEYVIPTKPYKYCRWCGAKMDEVEE